MRRSALLGALAQRLGHTVRLISPKFVTPYVKSNKTDAHDAEAICEAATRPTMRFVAVKTIEQQSQLAIHRAREQIVRNRTTLGNQIRGLLHEFGIVIAKGPASLRRHLPSILEDAQNDLTESLRALLHDLWQEWLRLNVRIEALDEQIQLLAQANPDAKRLMSIPGVGALTATAILATVGDARCFKNGRELAAFLGLVPRQHSTGGRPRLLGISKRGDRYLRQLLIHGARAVVPVAARKKDRLRRWVLEVAARRGTNKASVALANKNARIAWRLLTDQSEFHPAA